MYRVIDGNCTGKTKKLLIECGQDPNGLFVCAHPERVRSKCEAYNIPVVDAIGYNEWTDIVRQNGNGMITKAYNIYIDELEKFTNCVIPYLKGYSLTNED